MKKSFQIKEMKLRAISGPMGRPAAFTAIAAPSLPSSPTDWSDVNQFIKDIDSIINSLAPVLSLGTQLTQYLDKAQAQLAIPGQLHTKLSALQTETQFLYDFSSFLQLFPVFKEFLPLLTNGLGGELTNIKSLDSDMSQFVGATSSLSTTLQVNYFHEVMNIQFYTFCSANCECRKPYSLCHNQAAHSYAQQLEVTSSKIPGST